jgi:outer membrane lipoprotein SlyB
VVAKHHLRDYPARHQGFSRTPPPDRGKIGGVGGRIHALFAIEVNVNRYLPLQSLLLLCLSGCGSGYPSGEIVANTGPGTTSSEPGIIVGVRPVTISAADTATELSAGRASIAAFSTLQASLTVRTAASRTASNAQAYEYIVRKRNTELVCVTQRDPVPLPLAQKVLVLSGILARVVPDGPIAEHTRPVTAAAPALTQIAVTQPARGPGTIGPGFAR